MTPRRRRVLLVLFAVASAAALLGALWWNSSSVSSTPPTVWVRQSDVNRSAKGVVLWYTSPGGEPGGYLELTTRAEAVSHGARYSDAWSGPWSLDTLSQDRVLDALSGKEFQLTGDSRRVSDETWERWVIR